MSNAVIEFAPFRLTPAASEQALLEASDRFQREFLVNQPGFLRRELLRGSSGEFVDLVLWKDQASADAIMAAAATDPHCGAYFQVMEFDPNVDPAANVRHFVRMRQYPQPASN
jgi:hypothetical protein